MQRLALIIFSFMILNSNTAGQTSNHFILLNWEVGYSVEDDQSEKTWIAASVPGAIQLDIARAENYGPYIYAENWKDYTWMEDQSFTYRTSFKRPDIYGDDRLLFISKGIDYEFEISFNGTKLLYQEGMFTPVSLDLTNFLQDNNELLIKIFPIPKMHEEPADRTQAAQSVKPAVSYLWDWHPRLVPVGIWDDTYLEIAPQTQVTDSWVNYTLNEALTSAEINIEIAGTELCDHQITWSLKDAEGKILVNETVNVTADELILKSELQDPTLWWPHDHGDPYLYTSSIQVADTNRNIIQTVNQTIGFRKVRLVMNEGAWDAPTGFPKSRSVAPIQLEINGREIFSKGTNWVNPEIFPGIITRYQYEELIDRAVEANFNLLRVWGGGIVNKEAFYELCDEKGIMVWTEFPLACNNYEGTPEYLAVLRQESESIIKRIRKHPSNAIWSGGNELFNSWSRMTDQSLALRLLNAQCFELDPKTPYINTSPIYGIGHGHYVFRDMDTGEEVYSSMQRAKSTAYTEFGIPSPSSVEILKTIIPEDELWPPKSGGSWESHHAFNAWVGDTWLMQGMIEDYFGKSKDLDELVMNGQLIQCEGYKAIYEEARRQKPYCSMALNWCYNEPWPTAANNSIVSYPNIPKPAFYAVQNSCRPVLASAKITKLKWREGDSLALDIWLLNDSYEEVKGGKILVKLVTDTEEMELLGWEYNSPEPNTNIEGPTARIKVPKLEGDRFKIVLEVEDYPEYNSEYLLLYEPKRKRRKKTALLNQ